MQPFGFTFNCVWIRFKIRTKSLYCRIIVNKVRANADFAIGERIDPALWDSKKQKVTGGGAEAEIINARLQAIRAQIKQYELDLTNKGKPVTADILKKLFQGKHKLSYTLIETSEKHLDYLRKLPSDEIAESTIETYEDKHNNLCLFLIARKQKTITPERFTPSVAQDFINWLRTEKTPPSGISHAAKTLEYVRKVVRFSINQEWTTFNPLQAFRIKKGKHSFAPFLDDDERHRLESKTFEIERLQKIKDSFVFLCHTGLSFQDIKEFRASRHVELIDNVYWLNMSRIKTGVDFFVPLTTVAWKILQKYGGETLPIPSNVKFNAYLKEIQDICGIKTKLTVKVARTTFGMVMLNEMRVPLDVVSKMLGHANIQITEKYYAKVLKQKVIKDVVLQNPDLYKTGS